MSDTKTKAIGFLYTLTTNNEVRQSWAVNPTWDEFFESDSDPIVDTFNNIGGYASGRFSNPEQNEKEWQTAVVSMNDQIVEGVIDGDLSSSDFATGMKQRLAVLISNIVYNADDRQSFLDNPQSYIDNLSSDESAEMNFSSEFKDHLVKFGELVQGGEKDKAKSYLTEVLNGDMVAQYLKEQSLIW
ncbi:hypothetical protein [Marinibactrum halimedae]|uniref:Uncharacterized protein n=1 Tax=Marinibactrum halimedae TaxID=1444977 RepID=A0AA37TFE1_9GAMM|nr:hypothetical protein [Marinibactrum halimedae]MCD9460965.1 hypothetical protein [Marinibactrum halimedae]GLS28092.1 hypothetical protein GCM10007877_38110 [Marinibactrum halimedae]